MPVAHLGHSELLVTDIERSTRFFTELFGLSIAARDESRVYLRAWQDWEHHTLVLTESTESALGHIAWRVESASALDDAQAKLDALGIATRWVNGGSELGHGDALRFSTPGGLPYELYWEVEFYRATESALRSRYPSHPERNHQRGLAPRRLDHVNVLVDDVVAEQEWLTEHLGIRHNYYVTTPDGERSASWMSRTNLSHEVALMRNRDRTGGQLHHVAYFVDSPDKLLAGATLLAEQGVKIEWGPGAHGTSDAIFLYFKEPSGHRVEVWTGGMLVFAPDWKAIQWDAEASPEGMNMWGVPMPDSFAYGTPIAAPVSA